MTIYISTSTMRCHDNEVMDVKVWNNCRMQMQTCPTGLMRCNQTVKKKKNSALPIMQFSISHHKTLTAWCMSATPSISCNRCTAVQTQAETNADGVAMASCGWIQWKWRSVPLSSISEVQDWSSPAPRSLQKVPSQPHIYIQMCKFWE